MKERHATFIIRWTAASQQKWQKLKAFGLTSPKQSYLYSKKEKVEEVNYHTFSLKEWQKECFRQNENDPRSFWWKCKKQWGVSCKGKSKWNLTVSNERSSSFWGLTWTFSVHSSSITHIRSSKCSKVLEFFRRGISTTWSWTSVIHGAIW